MQRRRNEVLKKKTQIVSKEAANDEPETIFTNSKANNFVINDSQFQSIVEEVTNGPLAFEGFEIVEMTTSDKSTHNVNLVDTTIVNAKPNYVFDKTVESIAESAVMKLIQASNTCLEMEKTTNEFGNNQISNGKYSKLEFKLIET